MDPETLKVLITSGGPLGVLVFLVIVFLTFIRDRDAKQETVQREYAKRIESFYRNNNKARKSNRRALQKRLGK